MEAVLIVTRIVAEALIKHWGSMMKFVSTAFKIVSGVMVPAT